MTSDTSPFSFTFSIEHLDGELTPRSLTGVEELSGLFSFDVTFCYAIEFQFMQPRLVFADLLDRSAHLRVRGSAGQRTFTGVITRLRRRVSRAGQELIVATLQPPAWRLSLGRNCRIFQDRAPRAIVEQLCEEGGLQVAKNTFVCSGNTEPPAREYCVQYNESDWGFISRLLEEEGYFYRFEHGPQGAEPRITNELSILPDLGAIVFNDREQADAAEEHVSQLQLAERLVFDRLTSTSYDFKRPDLDLEAFHRAQDADPGRKRRADEVFSYPGGYTESKRGKALTSRRYHQATAESLIGEGRSCCPRLAPGARFSLQIPNGDKRRWRGPTRFLALCVHHEAEANTDAEGNFRAACTYHNSFTCVPADQFCLPPRRTRPPVIPGVQTATVVGPTPQSTDEIHTDAFGRVRVLFHWDRLSRDLRVNGPRPPSNDRRSRVSRLQRYGSCWIRVAQLWAGPRMGAQFIPRVGDEVVVQFIDGDPARPLIVGSVHNGKNMLPYDPGKRKTRSGIKTASTPGRKGHNELRFEDRAGAEEVYIHAQLDMNEVVHRDKTTRLIKGNRTALLEQGDDIISVKGNRLMQIAPAEGQPTGDRAILLDEGSYDLTLKRGARNVTLEEGDDQLTLKSGSREVTLEDGDDVYSLRGNRLDSVEGDIKRRIKGDITTTTRGNIKTAVNKGAGGGDVELYVAEGDAILSLASGDRKVTLKNGYYKLALKRWFFEVECGDSVLKLDHTGKAQLRCKSLDIDAGGSKLEALSSGVTVIGTKIKLN